MCFYYFCITKQSLLNTVERFGLIIYMIFMDKNAASGRKSATARKVNSKYLYWGGLLIISIVYFAVYSQVFDHKPDMNGDNIYYYSLGKALAEGKGYVNTIGFEETPHGHFPPGYPFIISLLVRIGLDMTGIKVFNGILLYLSCLIIYRLCFRISRSVVISFAVTLLMAGNSHLLRSATIMMSEIPFLFFSSSALLLFSLLHDSTKTGLRYWLLLAGVCVCTVTAYYVRGIGVTLWLALLVALITLIVINLWKNRKEGWRTHLQNNKLRMIAFACIAIFFVACKTPWDMRNRQLGFSSSYMGALTIQFGGTNISDFSGWVERVKLNAVRYITKELPSGLFCKRVTYAAAAKNIDWIMGLFIISMLLVGACHLRGVNLLLLYYLGATAVVLMLWPDIWTSPRFMSPVIPLLFLLFIAGLAYTATMLLSLLKSMASLSKLLSLQKFKTESLVPLVSLTLIICLYFSYYSAISIEVEKAESKEYNRHNTSLPLEEFLDAMRWVKNNTPNDARVSVRKPELFYIYSEGRKSVMFPQYATPEEIMDFFDKHRIDYVILDWWFRHAYATVLPAVQKHEDRFAVVNKIGGEGRAPATYILKILR